MSFTPPPEATCFPNQTTTTTCMGKCEVNTSTCICPPGQRDDMTLTRLANCASVAPYETIALGVSIGIGSFVFFLGLYYLRKVYMGNSRRITSGVFRVITLNLCISVCLVVASAIHLGQGYASPSFWFMFMLSGFFIGATLAGIFDTFLRVSFNSAMQPYPEKFVWVSLSMMVISLVIPFLVCFIASVVYVNDPASFNTALVVGLGLLPMHLVVSAPLFFSTVDQLIARTDEALGKSTASQRHARHPSVFLGSMGSSGRKLLLPTSQPTSPEPVDSLSGGGKSREDTMLLPGNSITSGATSSTFSTPLSTPITSEGKHVAMSPEERKANRQSLRELPVVGEGQVVLSPAPPPPTTTDYSTPPPTTTTTTTTAESPFLRVPSPKLVLVKEGSRTLKEPSADDAGPGRAVSGPDLATEKPRMEKSVSSRSVGGAGGTNRRASQRNNNDPQNPNNVNRTFLSLGKRLRTFRLVMLLVWAPLEIAGALVLAMLAHYKSPYMFVAFELLIVFAQFVPVSFLAVVVRVKPRLPRMGASQKLLLSGISNAEMSGDNGGRGITNRTGREQSSDNDSGAGGHRSTNRLSTKRSKETQLAVNLPVVAESEGKSEIFKHELMSVAAGNGSDA